jgi:hypothetical protein
VRKLIALLSLTGLLILGIAATARGDNPHPPGCKGDPHNCQPAPAQTTASTPAPPSVNTQTIVVSAPAAPPAAQSQTVTVVVQPSKVATVVRVKVKKLRRYCTRQRHGWRCVGHPPRKR